MQPMRRARRSPTAASSDAPTRHRLRGNGTQRLRTRGRGASDAGCHSPLRPMPKAPHRSDGSRRPAVAPNPRCTDGTGGTRQAARRCAHRTPGSAAAALGRGLRPRVRAPRGEGRENGASCPMGIRRREFGRRFLGASAPNHPARNLGMRTVATTTCIAWHARRDSPRALAQQTPTEQARVQRPEPNGISAAERSGARGPRGSAPSAPGPAGRALAAPDARRRRASYRPSRARRGSGRLPSSAPCPR